MKVNERRGQNLYWTISGNYEKKYQGSWDFYTIGEKGFLDKAFPNNQLNNFISKNTRYLSNGGDIKEVINTMAIEWTRKAFLSIRPGLKSYEKPYYNAIFQFLDKNSKDSLELELKYQYARFRVKKPLTCGPILGPLMEDILDIKNAKDSKEFFNRTKEVLDRFFHINTELVNEDIVVNLDTIKKEREVKGKKKRKIVEKTIREEEYFKEEIESAEFTNVKRESPDPRQETEETENLFQKSEDRIQKRIAMHFGKGEGSDQREIENKIATGIHQGMKIHLTKGNFANDMNSQFFKEQILHQRDKNLATFKENIHHYRRTIFELREILRKNLLDNLDQGQGLSSSGHVDVSQIWRYPILGDEKIFTKKNSDSLETFSVDILLDMSASQQERQEDVAIQGFLITEALMELRIPTRVMGFCNLFNYQVLRIFRDYKDPRKKNEEIFHYKAQGSNRDGLALRYIFETMDQIHVDKQVLIVLSDGKPNDHLHLSQGSSNTTVANYEGLEAVNDTALEVLQGRIKNKAILGVFTGSEEDLEQEKRIFGQDFVHISDLSRFSSIVGKYLLSLIERI